MFRSPFLIIVIVLSIVAITIFPVYTILVQNPQITQLFRENTIRETTHLAEQLSALLLTARDELSQDSLSPPFILQLERLQEDSHFIKLRIFTPNGEIIFSADEQEIGHVNNEAYFVNLVKSGNVVTKEVSAGTQSMDKQILQVDSIEIYVPIRRVDQVVGVFEIYYDITPQIQKLKRLVYRSYGILFGLGIILLLAVIAASIKAYQHLREREQAQEELRTLSVSDEMTGLYNRRGFYTLARQQKRLADRTHRGMLLVAADLNGLKEINDHFGHEAGDTVLTEAAEVLKESFRESDIIARLGGDEFAVLMPEQPDISQDLLFRRMENQIASINSRRALEYTLSISIGFARYDPEAPCTLDQLMATADAQMYRQKRTYKRKQKTRAR